MPSDHAFGVFKPVGHVVISFPSGEQADAAAQELAGIGVGTDAVHRFTDREMLARIDDDLRDASPLAAVGQELNLAKAQRALAARGYHWLVVRTNDDVLSRQVAELSARHGAERAQAYGRFVIEDLIEHPGERAQVAESPDRGLDAQTPSGREAERAELRPPPKERTRPGD